MPADPPLIRLPQVRPPNTDEKASDGLCCTVPARVAGTAECIALSATLYERVAESSAPDVTDTAPNTCSDQDPTPDIFVPVKQAW